MAKRSEPELCTVIRAENRSDGASGEMLNSVLQIISRQYEKRSRSLIASVDHETISALAHADAVHSWRECFSTKRPAVINENLFAFKHPPKRTALMNIAITGPPGRHARFSAWLMPEVPYGAHCALDQFVCALSQDRLRRRAYTSAPLLRARSL